MMIAGLIRQEFKPSKGDFYRACIDSVHERDRWTVGKQIGLDPGRLRWLNPWGWPFSEWKTVFPDRIDIPFHGNNSQTGSGASRAHVRLPASAPGLILLNWRSGIWQWKCMMSDDPNQGQKYVKIKKPGRARTFFGMRMAMDGYSV